MQTWFNRVRGYTEYDKKYLLQPTCSRCIMAETTWWHRTNARRRLASWYREKTKWSTNWWRRMAPYSLPSNEHAVQGRQLPQWREQSSWTDKPVRNPSAWNRPNNSTLLAQIQRRPNDRLETPTRKHWRYHEIPTSNQPIKPLKHSWVWGVDAVIPDNSGAPCCGTR